ncbi:MAG: hypothetical protein M3Y81_24455 [Chloroflexota bacterium]|nr:hypothetical protein [Chloroflexota bacterium]
MSAGLTVLALLTVFFIAEGTMGVMAPGSQARVAWPAARGWNRATARDRPYMSGQAINTTASACWISCSIPRVVPSEDGNVGAIPCGIG